MSILQEIYLIEVAVNVNKDKLPKDWVKTGGTKVCYLVTIKLERGDSTITHRLRVDMLLPLFRNAFVSSKRPKKIATPQLKSSNHAFSPNSTLIVLCGYAPSGSLRSWIVFLVWQSHLQRLENHHADLSLWKTVIP
jgi:hypothetical protein